MRRLFKFNNLEKIEKLIEVINANHFNIIIDKENKLLLVNEEIDNFNTILMGLMDIIVRNEHIQDCFDAWFDGLDRIHEMPKFINDKEYSTGWSMDGSILEDAIIIDFSIQEIKKEWTKSIKSNENPNNLGIEKINTAYIETNELQDAKDEYKKINKFLNLYKEDYAKMNNQNPNNIKIEFINYGKTELVYVLTDENDKKYTLLVKQPKAEKIEIMQEIINLRELKKGDDNVIAPINIFDMYDQALYRTPYIYQARCIASDENWGMYIPEPFYRFVPFTKKQESVVNTCMIAKLVSFYDFEKEEGLAACKLGGGDFIIPKGWEKEIPTIENTLNNLYLIAARKKVKCSFDEYIATIVDEFTRKTIDDDEKRLIINKRGRVAMDINDILNGIRLGKEIIKDRDGYTYKKTKIKFKENFYGETTNRC